MMMILPMMSGSKQWPCRSRLLFEEKHKVCVTRGNILIICQAGGGHDDDGGDERESSDDRHQVSRFVTLD